MKLTQEQCKARMLVYLREFYNTDHPERYLSNHENRKAMEALRKLLGSWPADDLRRAFVAGVEWWEFHQEGYASLAPADQMEATSPVPR